MFPNVVSGAMILRVTTLYDFAVKVMVSPNLVAEMSCANALTVLCIDFLDQIYAVCLGSCTHMGEG